MEIQNETQEIVSTSVVYEQDKAQIDMQIATAKAYPRNLQRATQNAIAIVTMDQDTAKTCTYSVPRGGKSITGPSVHLAKILAQQFGNMRIDAKVVAIDEKHVTSESVCFDLETNLAIKTSVKRSIYSKHGRFNDDMITVTGNAANSIAMRNAILAVIPRPLVDKVYNAAKQTITGDISDQNKLIAARKKVFDGLKGAYPDVTDVEILAAIGKASMDHVTGDDIITLIGIGTAIKDGDTNVKDAFKGGKSASKETPEDKEKARMVLLINQCKDLDSLHILRTQNPDFDNSYFEKKEAELKKS